MSTNTTSLRQGSAHSARGALAVPLAIAAILLGFSGVVALNAGLRPAIIAPAPVSDAQVQKALINIRAGERDSHSIGSDASVQKALIDVRAGERDSHSIGSERSRAPRRRSGHASVQKALIDIRTGERDSFSAGH